MMSHDSCLKALFLDILYVFNLQLEVQHCYKKSQGTSGIVSTYRSRYANSNNYEPQLAGTYLVWGRAQQFQYLGLFGKGGGAH